MSRPRNAGQPGTKQDTPPTGYERDFYEGSWPEQRDYMKGKKNPKLAAASKHCRLKGVKPFTKSFGSCMKAYFKKGR